MYLNHLFYLSQSSSPSSRTAAVAPQSAYHHLHPAVYPPTSPNYGEYNTDWGVEQVHALLHIANDMNGEPSTAGLAATTNHNIYRCGWITGGVPCNQGFVNFDDLIVHQGHVHDVQGSAARKLVCQWQLADGRHCGKEYRRDAFRRHIATHVGLSVACPECCKRFSREDSMRAHWRKYHGKA